VFVQGWAIAQLWLFWGAPIAGAVTAGVVYRSLFEGEVDEEQETKK
jgi:aquaporin Z